MAKQEILFNFNYSTRITPITTMEIQFKLSNSIMLEGITFTQPFVLNTPIFINDDVTIEVWQGKEILETYRGKTVEQPYNRIAFSKLIFLQVGNMFSIKISMPATQKSSTFINGWKRLHSFVRTKWNHIEIIPMVNNAEATGDIETIISAIHCQSCAKIDFIQMYGKRFKFGE